MISFLFTESRYSEIGSLTKDKETFSKIDVVFGQKDVSLLRRDKPALALAPMEGVTDAPMRALLTERGGFTFCVSEFLRVTQDVLPSRVFYRHVPEYENGCVTPSAVPVQIQLLGGDEEKMALNAQKAYELGARAIDINFGCPSPVVNRHDGGASLLRYPERIERIVRAVREILPENIPVSAKLRLGWDSLDDIFWNAERAAAGGASWITIHARTKKQGYAPPAHWKYIGEVRKNLNIPIVANGDIWTFDDFLRCQEVTGCQHFMLGRGALANPNLPLQIAQSLGISLNSKDPIQNMGYHSKDWKPLILRLIQLSIPRTQGSRYTACRVKQWLKFAAMRNTLPWFENLKRADTVEDILTSLDVSE